MRVVSAESETIRPLQTLVDQLVLADHPVAIAHQIDEKVEHLRLERDPLAAAAQFATLDIEHMIAERESHGTPRPDRVRLKEKPSSS